MDSSITAIFFSLSRTRKHWQWRAWSLRKEEVAVRMTLTNATPPSLLVRHSWADDVTRTRQASGSQTFSGQGPIRREKKFQGPPVDHNNGGKSSLNSVAEEIIVMTPVLQNIYHWSFVLHHILAFCYFTIIVACKLLRCVGLSLHREAVCSWPKTSNSQDAPEFEVWAPLQLYVVLCF